MSPFIKYTTGVTFLGTNWNFYILGVVERNTALCAVRVYTKTKRVFPMCIISACISDMVHLCTSREPTSSLRHTSLDAGQHIPCPRQEQHTPAVSNPKPLLSLQAHNRAAHWCRVRARLTESTSQTPRQGPFSGRTAPEAHEGIQCSTLTAGFIYPPASGSKKEETMCS